MLPCKEIVKLLSSEEKGSLFRKAEIKMHLLMCEHCSSYSKHLSLMKKGFKLLFARLTEVKPENVDHLETKVIEKIKKSAGK
jgi:hypothetical protein